MKLKPYLFFLLAIFLCACNDDNSPAPTPISPSTGGTPPISVPSAFTLVSNALTSLSVNFPSTTCGTGGTPTSTVGSPTYAADEFFCSLTSNSSEQNSIRNGYYKSAGVLCALKKVTTLSNSTTPTVHENIIISESDACFGPNGADINNNGNTTDSLTVSFRETMLTGADYDQEFEIQLTPTFDPARQSDVTVFTKDSSTILATKSYQTGDVSEAVINKTNGELFLEDRNYQNFIHTRLYAKGTINNDGTFPAISNMQVIKASGNTGSEISSELFATDGTKKWFNHFVGTTQAPGYDQCSDATPGACSALVIPYNAQFHNFTGHPQTNYNNGTMMSTTAPITMVF
jgi:hypothetical protein